MEERRRANRRPLNHELVIKRIDGNSHDEVKVRVVDLSKCGIGFECNDELIKGSVYEGSLTIWTKETIDILIEVVRIERFNSGFHYGATFLGMSENDKYRIELFDAVESAKEIS